MQPHGAAAGVEIAQADLHIRTRQLAVSSASHTVRARNARAGQS